MASCHSLVLLNETIQGDPLDLKMFEATTWVSLCLSGNLRNFINVSATQTSLIFRNMQVFHMEQRANYQGWFPPLCSEAGNFTNVVGLL